MAAYVTEQNLDLYVKQNVCLMMKNGDEPEIRGELLALNDEELILEIDGAGTKRIPTAELKDIRYRGRLTDFHTGESMGEIDNTFRFHLADCVSDEEKAGLRYHELEYTVNCHLALEREESMKAEGVIKETLGRIVAKDVILEKNPVHVLNTNVLKNGVFLYTFHSGEKKVGILDTTDEAYALFYGGKQQYSFTREEVVSITKCPQVNDSVVVCAKKQISGLVTAVKADGFCIYTMDHTLEWVDFQELDWIRYQGKMTEYYQASGKRQFSIDGKYMTKEAYLQNWNPESENHVAFSKGMVVTYTVSVNMRGMIARDLYVEQNIDRSRTGIILTMDQYGKGWIGSHFITKAKREKVNGDVYFFKADLPQNMKYEPYKYIYIVKYSAESTPDANGRYRLQSMELLERIDYASTGAVHVYEDGSVEVVPFFRTCIDNYKDREVCVILKDSEKKVSGRLVSVDEAAQECTLLRGEGFESETQAISLSEIQTIRIIGKVTKYYDNGTGYIDGKNYFNIKNVKNGTIYSDLEGKRVSFLLQNSNKGDLTDAVDLEVTEEVKSRSAQVIAEKNVVIIGYSAPKGYTVMDMEDYDAYADADASAYVMNSLGEGQIAPGSLDTDKFDYPIVVKTLRKEGKVETDVEVAAGMNKRHFGYLTKAINQPGKRYGFITHTPIDKNSGVYCSISEPIFEKEDLEAYDFDTWKNYYPVAYTIQYEREKHPAGTVKVLGEKAIKIESGERKNYRYGFLTSYRKADDVAVIYKEYNIRAEKNSIGRKEVKLGELGWNESVNTSNKMYFVTYEVGKNQEVTRIVDMEGYSKKGIISATEKDGIAQIRKETFQEPEGVSKQALELAEGEILLVGNQVYQYAGKSGDRLLLHKDPYSDAAETVTEIPGNRTDIYRIGILTGVDDSFENAYINDYLKFSTEKLQERTRKVYKNDSKKLVVLYSQEASGSVREVTLPEAEIQGLFPWKKGCVVSVNAEERKERKAVVRCEEGNIESEYYFFVDTDSAIRNYGDNLVGIPVYTQIVKCSPGKSGEYTNKWLALDLRCESEKMIVEEYEKEGQDGNKSIGYRVKRDWKDKKNIFQVDMRHYDFWKVHKDREVEILFKPYKAEGEDTEVLIAFPKFIKYKNPYTNAAAGEHLQGGDEMFKGRDAEKEKIWKYIIKDNKRIVKGRRVILYGQKRCGKSSLIEMIKYDMGQVDEIRDNSVIVSVSAADISYNKLEKTLCKQILFALEDTIGESQDEECRKLMKSIKAAKKASSWDEFEEVIKSFGKVLPKYSIVLFLDEFTRVCMQVLNACEEEPERREELVNCLSVIKKFTGLQITQVIIGHANMENALKKLGLGNEILEKSMNQRLNAFTDKDARTLILEPMEKVLGEKKFYSEEDEDAAIKYMMELSGNSPYVLMNLCKRVFDAYTENRLGSVITVEGVDTVAREFCSDIRNHKADTFDAILKEVGDPEIASVMHDEELSTYKFLETMVSVMEEESRYCTRKSLVKALQSEERGSWTTERIAAMFDTLKSRGVIEEGEGERYRIIMGLFVRHIQLKKKA